MNRKGQALILCYIVIAVFIAFLATLSSKAISERNISMRNKLNAEALYLAEGAIENSICVFTAAIANYQVAPDIATYNVTTTFTTFGGTSVTTTITRLDNNDRLVLEGTTNVLVRNYEMTTTVTHPQNNNVTVTVHQIIARRLIPTFQHSVFYNDDLEILPGSNMTLSGRLHSNKDIYLDAEGGATLTIDSTHLRSAGNIYNQRKNNSGQHLLGNVAIKVNDGSGTYKNMNIDGVELDCKEANWETESQTRWAGSVQSAVHGVNKLTAPSVASTSPTGYYATNANVVIENGTLKKGGTVLTEGVDYPEGTIITNTELYDYREAKYIKTTDIDLGKLSGVGYTKADGTPYENNLPSNGLLYATRNDAGSTYEPGIRLVNADTINRDAGLTVVTDDPLYIQGSYNTESKKPASIISDSLNLLSNNWNDDNSSLAKSYRTASETTYNCAFIAGIKTTTDTSYNGGLENYPRLHENWSGINLNITGSFVALWNSSTATGNWSSASYSPPKRYWYYDTAFNTTSNLPPFTPMAVEAQRVAWWKD